MKKFISYTVISVSASLLLLDTAFSITNKTTDKQLNVNNSKHDNHFFEIIALPFKAIDKLINDIKKKNQDKGAVIKDKNDPNMAKNSNKKIFYTIFHPIKKSHKKSHKMIIRDTKSSTITTTKHQSLLLSQADYPINQEPKVDAKGVIQPLFKTAPYVGASGGLQTNLSQNPGAVAYQGADGVLSAGASAMITRRFYLAGEFFGGSNISAKNFVGNNINTFKISSGWDFGGDIIPGYMITDTVLAYLRFGVIRNQFHTSPVSSAAIAPFNKRSTYVKNGWQIGAGTQTNLYKNLDARVEYIISIFNSLPVTHSKAEITQANIGLVYKFTDVIHI